MGEDFLPSGYSISPLTTAGTTWARAHIPAGSGRGAQIRFQKIMCMGGTQLVQTPEQKLPGIYIPINRKYSPASQVCLRFGPSLQALIVYGEQRASEVLTIFYLVPDSW